MNQNNHLIRTFKNNKAKFEFYENGTVRKIFFNNSANTEEYKRLKQLKNFFKTIQHKDFTYSFPDIYSGDLDKGILMDFIPGKDLIHLQNFSESDYFHAGVWLGYYHSLSRKNDKVKIFHDYTPHNVMISRNEKIVTGMDPGHKAMEWRDYYYDIMIFFTSIIISHFKEGTLFNKNCIRFFINGYNEYGDFIYVPFLYKKNISEILNKMINDRNRRNRHNLIKRYTGYSMVWFYAKKHLKPTLKEFKS